MNTDDVQSFTIKLDPSCSAVVPGQLIKGIISFEVVREILLRRFTFKVIGREKAHIRIAHRTGSGSNVSTHYSDYESKRNFFKANFLALGAAKNLLEPSKNQWKGSMAVGSYSFPFSVRIPGEGMLPSLDLRYADDTGVHYMVKAKVFFLKSETDFTREVTQVAKFDVVPAMPASQLLTAAPLTLQSVLAPRNCCYMCASHFCARGNTKVSLLADRSIIIFNKDLAVNGSVTIDNSESKEPVEIIKMQLMQLVTYTAEGKTRVSTLKLSSAIIPSNVPALKLGSQSFSFQLPLGRPTSGVPFPSTFKGEFITNVYVLRATCGDGEGEEHLAEAPITAASSAVISTTPYATDESDDKGGLPIQSATAVGKTVPNGKAMTYLYSPPSGATAQLPSAQVVDIGPFQPAALPSYVA